MALFHYRYINPKGKKKSGMIDAEGIMDAKEKLRSKNVLVTALSETKEKKKSLLGRNKERIGSDQLITLFSLSFFFHFPVLSALFFSHL